MVKQAYGVAGKDIRIGADILTRAALDEEFVSASGQYLEDDSDRFASSYLDPLDVNRTAETVQAIKAILAVMRNSSYP